LQNKHRKREQNQNLKPTNLLPSLCFAKETQKMRTKSKLETHPPTKTVVDVVVVVP